MTHNQRKQQRSDETGLPLGSDGALHCKSRLRCACMFNRLRAAVEGSGSSCARHPNQCASQLRESGAIDLLTHSAARASLKAQSLAAAVRLPCICTYGLVRGAPACTPGRAIPRDTGMDDGARRSQVSFRIGAARCQSASRLWSHRILVTRRTLRERSHSWDCLRPRAAQRCSHCMHACAARSAGTAALNPPSVNNAFTFSAWPSVFCWKAPN